jgi:2-amino-4-hydroxy-6-hydroxymethyldihydropteridine diphosphokinase
MPSVAIALGSNLGDRQEHLDWAVERLRGMLSNVRVSPIIETDPVDVPDRQPRFLNAVVVGESDEPPDVLLSRLQQLEAARGRERKGVRAARTLDLDLILYGDAIIQSSQIDVPHPRFRNRRFVLEPLAGLAPEWRDPITGRTIRELLDDLS